MNIPQNTTMYSMNLLAVESGEPPVTYRDNIFEGYLFKETISQFCVYIISYFFHVQITNFILKKSWAI